MKPLHYVIILALLIGAYFLGRDHGKTEAHAQDAKEQARIAEQAMAYRDSLEVIKAFLVSAADDQARRVDTLIVRDSVLVDRYAWERGRLTSEEASYLKALIAHAVNPFNDTLRP